VPVERAKMNENECWHGRYVEKEGMGGRRNANRNINNVIQRSAKGKKIAYHYTN